MRTENHAAHAIAVRLLAEREKITDFDSDEAMDNELALMELMFGEKPPVGWTPQGSVFGGEGGDQ